MSKEVFAVEGKIHGDGPVIAKWQRKVGKYLATSGSNRTVFLWDRTGACYDQIELPGKCVGLDWSCDGGLLAVISEKTNHVTIWQAQSKQVSTVDTKETKGLTFLAWSTIGATLAVGSARGTLVLYNHRTTRVVPNHGHHKGRIISGVWSSKNLLCMVGEDKKVTITNENGDRLHDPEFDAPLSCPQFFENAPWDAEGESSVTVSLVTNAQALYLWNLANPMYPTEMEFQQKYGAIVTYNWFQDGKVLVGFVNGYVCLASTHPDFVGTELFGDRAHSKAKLTDAIVSAALCKGATCGDDAIKIYDLVEPYSMYHTIKLEEEHGKLHKLSWSDDGHLLTVSTIGGAVYTFLTKLPMIGAASSARVASLSGLTDLTIISPVDNFFRKIQIPLQVEPAFCAVSTYSVAVGLNNQAWIYSIDEDGHYETIGQRTYFGNVEALCLNDEFAAALCEGKLHLHLIEPKNEDSGHPDEIYLPDDSVAGNDKAVVSHALTDSMCIYAMQGGRILFFLIEDWVHIGEFTHECEVRQLFPSPTGTRVLFVDEKNDVFMYNPVTEEKFQVEGVSTKVEGLLWDQNSPTGSAPEFVAYDDQDIQAFGYIADHFEGPRCTLAGTSPRGPGTKPLFLNNGNLTSLMPSGRTADNVLETHEFAVKEQGHVSHPKQCATQNIALGRYASAFVAALNVGGDTQCLETLYNSALQAGDVLVAYRTAQLMGSSARAAQVEPLLLLEETKTLRGRIALIFGDVVLAEKMFLESSQPIEALWMNRDLLRWEKALQQATAYAPSETPYISREYAQQLEFTGSFDAALEHFERGVTNLPEDAANDATCQAGIVRMLLRKGEVRQGLELAEKLNSRQLWRDCGAILQGMDHLSEAAKAYSSGHEYDKAAAMFIKLKNWKQVATILPNVKSAKMVVAYAKAREADGAYPEAADAYEQAKEYDALVRVCLQKLSDPDRAVQAVQLSKSVAGAKMVAQFFMGLNDATSAIKFLFMSGASSDAFKLAQANGKMDVYAQVLGDDAPHSDYEMVASHYESTKDYINAGAYYIKCRKYATAVNLLLQDLGLPDDAGHIDLAIDAVGKANDDALTHQVIQYLLGATSDGSKEASYLFKLYMALKRYPEAARTAVVISTEQQKQGHYRAAHSVLLAMHQQLQADDIRIPNDITNNLMLLHSYILGKAHIKRNDHVQAARLLCRVANAISMFPSGSVNILTSTVVECWRADLKASAFEYAALLMRPEYKKDVDPKYKNKLEQIVRRQEKQQEPEEAAPCCFCASPIEKTELSCHSCDTVMPYCIVTGQHMVEKDWAYCNNCKFPALRTAFLDWYETEECCPMCGPITREDIVEVANPAPIIKKYRQMQNSGGALEDSFGM